MFRIAVCDDERTFLDIMESEIRQYFLNQKNQYELVCFDNPEKMINQYHENNFDLILLDIQMNQLNGMDTAKILRKEGYDRTLAFITSCKDYAIEGYKVAAYRYLVKPFERKELHTILEYAESEQNKRSKYIVVKTEQQTLKLNMDDIIYVETFGHMLLFHTKDKKIQTRMTMKEFIKQSENDFAKIHKSYVVNLSHVKSFDSVSVISSINETIPISRNYLTTFKEQIAKYWGNRLNG